MSDFRVIWNRISVFGIPFWLFRFPTRSLPDFRRIFRQNPAFSWRNTQDNRGIPNPSNRFIRNFILKKVCLRCIFLKTLCCNPIVWGSRCLTPRQKNPKHPISTLFGTFSLLCTGTSHITHFTAHLQTQQSTSGTVTFACRLNRPWWDCCRSHFLPIVT